ncbi:MAG: DUF2461 domain-containing protein [Planctomycetes bacterium]|nr:DUF2461 domain-containing protein [Planctomycetota bacterium]
MFQFLEELSDNNNRPWFQENKPRYEREVREPSLAFIRAFAPRLKKISPFFTADDRRVGGSLMRVYRDTRFGKDKTPYKTNVGVQFRHEMGRDVHAPGFYVHVAPGECFLGAGTWRPDGASLRLIRQAIVERADRWRRATRGKRFRECFRLAGDSLKRSPRDFPADHPLVEDLKRKDLIGLCDLKERDVLAARFLDHVANAFTAARPLMRFLCEALHVPF